MVEFKLGQPAYPTLISKVVVTVFYTVFTHHYWFFL